jgi:hypothetical protein
METYDLQLPDLKRSISVLIDRKNIKTTRLRVYPDMTVKVSVSKSTPLEWVEEYLNSKNKWISKKLCNFKQTAGYAATTEIRNGYSIRFLGEDLIFALSEDSNPSVYIKGKALHISSPDICNQEKLANQFDRWWRKESYKHLSKQVDNLYPIVEKYGVPRPKIWLRRMRTLWGSCSQTREAITFNLYLTKAKPAYIEYVVLHELVHFLYPNHSKQFYNFLSSYMPDWKDRKNVLDQDVVHGL